MNHLRTVALTALGVGIYHGIVYLVNIVIGLTRLVTI